MDVHRAGAEVLGVPWEKCDVVWGDTSKHLPFTCVSGGSQTTHAMTRAAHAVAMDARKKTPGNRREESRREAGRLRRRRRASLPERRGREMTLAEAARHAIELGGAYDGHEPPEDVNKMTRHPWRPSRARSGAAARDNYPRDGMTHSYVASFAESRSTSRPASTTSSIFSPMRTSAR